MSARMSLHALLIGRHGYSFVWPMTFISALLFVVELRCLAYVADSTHCSVDCLLVPHPQAAVGERVDVFQLMNVAATCMVLACL